MKNFCKNEEILKQALNKAKPYYDSNGKLDIIGLADSLNIKLITARFDDESDRVSGMIEKTDTDQWTIYVNEDDHLTRQRFTIAHELGHYFSYQYDGYSRDLIKQKEKHADFQFTRSEKITENEKKMEREAN